MKCDKKAPPAGIVLHRVELVVDGGHIDKDGGHSELYFTLPDDPNATPITVSMPIPLLRILPIGSRVVLQLEVLPGAPKITSKTSTKKRGRR